MVADPGEPGGPPVDEPGADPGRAVHRLVSGQSSTAARVRSLRERAQEAVREKRESLDAGDPVPHDKRPI